MTREEAVNKNLELSFEFDRYLFEHPKFAEKIPDNALVVLLPQYDEALREYNLKIAEENRESEQQLVLVEIASLKPQKSRLTRPRLKVMAERGGIKPRIREQLSVAA